MKVFEKRHKDNGLRLRYKIARIWSLPLSGKVILFFVHRLSWIHISKIRFSWAILIVSALSLVACNNEHTVYIAVVGDESGDNKNLGVQLKHAANFFESNVIGTSGSRRIQTVFRDDKGNPELSRQIALELVANPNIVAVVGHSTSATTQAAQDVYTLYGMPLLVPIATYSSLTETSPRVIKNAVRLVPSNQQQAALIAEVIDRIITPKMQITDSLGQTTSAVLVYYEPSEYGNDLGTRIVKALWTKEIYERRKKRLTTNPRNGALQTEPAREDIRDYPDVRIVIFAGYHNQARDLVKEIAGRNPEIIFVLTDGSKDSEFFERLGTTNYKAYVTFVAPDWSNAEQLEKNGYTRNPAQLKELLDYIRRRSSVNGDLEKTVGYTPIAVDAIHIVYEIAQSNPTDWDTSFELRNLVFEELFEEDHTHLGFFSTYQFTSDGELQRGRAYLYRIQGTSSDTGEFTQVTLSELN